jgi:feruloyl esterase
VAHGQAAQPHVLCPFQDTVNYYERVAAAMGGVESVQFPPPFFVVPGMWHTGGGPGLNDIGQKLTQHGPQDREHDGLTALVAWVEEGIPPDRLIVTGFHQSDPTQGIRRRRPVFPYPKFPHYRGGPSQSPESYETVAHERGGVAVPAPRYLN